MKTTRLYLCASEASINSLFISVFQWTTLTFHERSVHWGRDFKVNRNIGMYVSIEFMKVGAPLQLFFRPQQFCSSESLKKYAVRSVGIVVFLHFHQHSSIFASTIFILKNHKDAKESSDWTTLDVAINFSDNEISYLNCVWFFQTNENKS